MTAVDVNKSLVRCPQEGTHYLKFMRNLAESIRCKSYFEIGVSTGKSLRNIHAKSVAVDPQFGVTENVMGKKPELHLFQMASDDFFARHDLASYFPGGFDLAFLDGMHQFEFLLRDFYNTERYAHAKSVILLHDCLPINAEMTERVYRQNPRVDAELAGYWTGDVWKLVPILRKHRPDLRVTCLNCGPTGLVVVTDLDPKSTLLRERYPAIVEEYAAVALTEDTIAGYHQSVAAIDAGEFRLAV